MRPALISLCAVAGLAAAAPAQLTQNVVMVNDQSTDVGSTASNTRKVVWVDLDNDGDLDLFALNFATPNQAYHNQGAGSLVEDMGVGNALLGSAESLGVGFGDIDGDGDQDAVIANGSNLPNTVLRNLSAAPDDQAGVFTDVLASGIENEGRQSYDAALGDLDNDGDLDLIVANRYDVNDLYWGQGDGTFVHDTSTPIDNTTFASRDVDLVDMEGDGDLDVLVANSTSAHNLYFVNLGGLQGGVTGTFGGRSFDVPGATTGKSFGGDLADLDNDGLLDIVFANRDEPNAIHRNISPVGGVPAFSRVLGTALDLFARDSYDVALGDLEGDGDVDIVVANRLASTEVYLSGSTDPLTVPGEGFEPVLAGEVANDRGNSRAVALADLHAYPDPATGQPITGTLELAVANTGSDANWLYRSYGAQWSSLGGGLGGDLGAPEHGGQGHTAAGQTIGLTVENAQPAALAALVLSVSVAAIPFKGGTLLADPTPGLGQILLVGATDGSGSLVLPVDLPAVLPPGVVPGLAFYTQMLVADDSAPVDVGLSNGVRLRLSN